MIEDIAPKPLGGAPGHIGAWGSQDAFGCLGDVGSGPRTTALAKASIPMTYTPGCPSADARGRVGSSDSRLADSSWARFFVNVVMMIRAPGFSRARDTAR